MAPNQQGRYELIFGHGRRISNRDTTDPEALELLQDELFADEQIQLGGVENAELAKAINTLLQKVNIIMADLTALQAADADIKAAVVSAANEISTLVATLASANANNDQAGVDAVAGDLQTAASNLSAAVSGAETPAQADPTTEVPTQTVPSSDPAQATAVTDAPPAPVGTPDAPAADVAPETPAS